MIILRLIWESLNMALQTFSSNRLRSVLSLLGITIGIFAIISVFTIVDSLEKNIRESVSSLGSNVLYIEKWPWAPEEGEEYAWWKYLNRPQASYEEYEHIERTSQLATEACFVTMSNRTLTYENNRADDISLFGVSDGFQDIRSFEIKSGRYFSPFEAAGGSNIAVLGSDLAGELFQQVDPVGKEIEISGHKVNIVGVMRKQGKGTFDNNNLDEVVVLPIHFIKRFVDIRSGRASPQIWVMSRPGVSVDELRDEMRFILRSYRRLKPTEEDTFAVNQTSIINNQLDQVFKVINIAGFFIGIFSIIVGGFGIANIMFVSVKERTHVIGIQKAIGAKRFFILMQFLFEAIILSLVGGIVGLLLIGGGALLVNYMGEFTLYLTMGNVILGLVISSVIGLVSGFAPAYQAARMDPVVAINTTF